MHEEERYYSMYGHVEKLAEEIKKGAASVEGVEAKLWQVPETLPDEVLGKMGAPPKSDIQIITPGELAEADGFIFGFPTRFGMMSAQFKAFLDATGGLWKTQQLAGKPAGIFYSTGSQGGGQETTALTAITQLVHHGMIFVPIGYTFGAGMFEMEKVKGGSPYGAGTFAGDGSRQPSELELEQAFHQGKTTARIFQPKLRSLAGTYRRESEQYWLQSQGFPDPIPLPPVTTSPVIGSISDSDLPRDILSSLRHQAKGRAMLGQISERLSVSLNSHMKAVNVVQWSASHAHLLASAGMDHTICIWNVWSRDQKKARVLNYHSAAVKDVKWSQQGLFVLSCGYDCSSRLIDVEKGLETQVFKEDQVVGVIKFHPDNPNIFLSGGLKGFLRLWDIRTGKVVQEYIRGLGPILDVEFTNDAKQFISSSDVSKSNVSENSIIVWDLSRQIPLSNQVYVEAYTCPCIRCHPFDPYFVAQSNGNYIAIFSSKPPFKLEKFKRYESHSVSGFPIKCNFSLDGEKLASGSSDGCIYFYNSRSSELIKKIKAYEQACIDVAFHPLLPNVIASCSWNGDVSVFE
ncbi:hypothetical protein F0562_010208 [Nyssa sinensis]|uniref:NAD(P)H dehydrogenase (quinone) n=1 Tax=Nyssa sinensis TaxID=561372 RepID=A0A5J4ZY79_9ASTE|nr:hypothetical protein F0562_010208 [Nyssa sinensis]